MTIVRWEKPPVERPRGDWQRTATLLRSKPNTWALVVENDTKNYAYRVSAVLKEYGCECVTRLENNRVSVWARHRP